MYLFSNSTLERQLKLHNIIVQLFIKIIKSIFGNKTNNNKNMGRKLVAITARALLEFVRFLE